MLIHLLTLLYLEIYSCFQAYRFHLYFRVIPSVLQDIEATIHCAEWLSIVGGSSTGDQRIRYHSTESCYVIFISFTIRMRLTLVTFPWSAL